MNLGGFINVTFVPMRARGVDAVRGFDLCACNHLLDRVARARLGSAYDADGAAASRGTCSEALAERISLAIAPTQTPGTARRSLGTGDEAARLVELTSALPPDDACRTIVEAIADATARTLRSELAEPTTDILIAGGSARNRALQAAIARRTGAAVRTTDESHGVPVGMREAAEMAILGALADDGVRYSLRQVTGAESLVPESAVINAGFSAGNAQD
jgi:anhydro-N-acetylmuramic acid kinase